MPEPLESKREQAARSPESVNEGVDAKKLKDHAEGVMKKLGYKISQSDTGRAPQDFKPAENDTDRARPLIVSEKKDEMQVFQDVSTELRALLKKQSESSLTFAETVQYNRDRLITRAALLRGSRQFREGDNSAPSLKEFDESLVSELTEFDDEVIYDYLSTIRRYAEYASKIPTEARDPQMKLWEKMAEDEMGRLETVADLYTRIENISIATIDGTKVNDSHLNDIPQTLSDLTNILGIQENGQNVLKVKVWNEEGKDPRVIEKSIVLDEALFTSPARQQDLNYVKDFCRQLIRATAGKGVDSSLGVSNEVQKEINEAYKPRTIRERLAKFAAKIIVGTTPNNYRKNLTNVRMPHAMYGKLLTNHVGIIQAKGVPEFDPKNLERIPLDLKQLGELRNAMKALSDAHEENTLYTLSTLLNQTMDLMTPGSETLPLVQKDKASRLEAMGKLDRGDMAKEVREGITVDQPSENIAALGNTLTILEDGFSVQLNSVSQAEKRIDSFMNNRLIQAIELLNDWKIPLMKIMRYAPPNFILSQYFPELKGSTGAEELVIQLRTELDAVRKKNEGLKKGMTTMKEALKKAIEEMKAQKNTLQTLSTERRALLDQLHAAKTDQQRAPILASLERNSTAVQGMREAVQNANTALSRSFIDATDASLSILEESQIADSFYTSRDKVGMTAFITSATIFAEWISSGGVSYTLGKTVQLASKTNPVTSVLTTAVSPVTKGAWQVWRRAMLSPVVLSDARKLYTKIRGTGTANTAGAAAETASSAADASSASRVVNAAEAAREGILASKLNPEVQAALKGILENPEFAQVMKARGMKPEQVAETILRHMDDVDSLLAIEKSQGGRRMLLGALVGGEAEVARTLSAAKAARVLMTTLNVVGVVGDAFGLAMACVDYQENNQKIVATKNPVLKEFYESARPIIIARGAVSGGLLIGGTLILFAQGAVWMGPVGLVMAGAALGAEGVRQTMNAKEEVLKYYAMDEKDLLSTSTEGQMLEWVGKTDPVMRTRLNWYHAVLPDEQVADMNINARRNGYRSYFMRTAAEVVRYPSLLDIPQESFIRALTDPSSGATKRILKNETQATMARFVADAVSYVSEHTNGQYTLVSADVLEKATLFAKANEKLRPTGQAIEADSSSMDRIVRQESIDQRNATAKQIEAMSKTSGDSVEFTHLLLEPLRHDLSVLDQKVLTSDLSDDMKTCVRGWYAEQLWDMLHGLFTDTNRDWNNPRQLDGIQDRLRVLLTTQPVRVVEQIKKSDKLGIYRTAGSNPGRLSLAGIVDYVNSYRFVAPTELGTEGRALPLENLTFYSMTGKGKKAVLKVPKGKDIGWVSSDIPMYQVASYDSSPSYNIPQGGHPAYFFLKKGVTYSFWSEDKKTQYVIKAE